MKIAELAANRFRWAYSFLRYLEGFSFWMGRALRGLEPKMSSYLIAAPEALATASADLSGIGEAIREATTAAAPSTTGIVPAAADEVSAAIGRLFGTFGEDFHALSAQAAAVPCPVCAVVVLGRELVWGRRGGQCIQRRRRRRRRKWTC